MLSRLPLYAAIFLLIISEGLADISSTVYSSSSISTEYSSGTTQASHSNPLQLLILHAENPSGKLENNQDDCSDFAFAGEQCQLIFKYHVSLNSAVEKTVEFGYGNSGDNHIGETYEIDEDFFPGFNISGTLSNKNGGDIATFEYVVDANQPKGIYTINALTGATGANIKIAWKSMLKVPHITNVSTTPQTTPIMTSISTETPGSTISTTPGPTTTPLIASDCDDYQDRTNGPKKIYINNVPIDVYCEFGKTSGALTTIQSRGELNTSSLSDDIKVYETPFGKAEKGNTFWLGLDNMAAITKDGRYNLYVEVCCHGVGTIQKYHNFSIGDNNTNYILNAAADTLGVGLDLKAVGQTDMADIGSPFSTISTYNNLTKDDVTYCDILYTYDPSVNKATATGSGGWWFGSCANNLNGNYINQTSVNATCSINPSEKTTGIELRTTRGVINPTDLTYIDNMSYARVRMAIYRKDAALQGFTPNAFCT